MAGISIGGIGSGLDVNSLVDQLVAAEGDPTTTRLDLKETEFQTELSAFGVLKGAVSDFQSTVSGLSLLSAFQTYSAASTDEDVFTATASSLARPETHTVEVSVLAQAHALASSSFTAATDTVGEGTLTFRFGTYESGPNTFTPNPDTSIQTVTIDASNNSLQGIRDAVNSANIGVNASVINDGSGYRLVFSSSASGEDNGLEVTITGDSVGTDTDNTGLSQLAYDPTATAGNGKNMTETAAAKDAAFKIDGLDMTRESNTVTGAIEGVTLTLKSTNVAAPETVTVSADTTAANDAVDSFVSSYNVLADVLSQLSSYDPETQTAGILLGDSLVRSIQTQLRGVVSGTVGGLGGDVRSLADMGVTTQSDGSLLVDSTKLQSALNNNFSEVAKVFAVVGTPSDSLVSFVSHTSDTKAGTYSVEVDTLPTQGDYVGTTNSSLIVGAANDTFALNVDGVISNTITLTQKTYASGAALATEVQSRINGDAALTAAGVSVTVAYVTDHLEITSSAYGSDSTVSITSVDTTTVTTLGLGTVTGTSTAGVDVAGKIAGASATGSGRFLTGVGNADGLKLEIVGGSTGLRGSVTFTRGIADQLNTLLDNYLGTDNLIDARTAGLNSRIDDISEQRVTLDARLDALEARYRAQFTALDGLMAQFQTTSNFLTQQLANLPEITINK